MGQIKSKTVTVRRKNTSSPQRKIQARRVVVNAQVQRLNRDAAKKRR